MSSSEPISGQPESGRDSIVEAWYRAIAETAYVPFPAAEVRRRLALLVDQALAAVSSDEGGLELARQIGAALPEMHYLKPQALEATLKVLPALMEDGLPGTALHQSALPELAAGVGSGFYARAVATILGEQETVRQALIGELREAEQALRRAHSHLEQRVVQRTAELVAANAELRREVAERQRAEDAHRQSEERFRELVENMREVVYILDDAGIVTYVSPSASTVLGYQPAEMEGRSFREFVYGPDLDRGVRGFESVLESGAQGSEYRVVAKPGEVRCVHSSSRPVLQEGRVVGVQGLLVDVTDRRRAEDALRESEARYRAVVEAQGELICRFKPDGRVIFLNNAYRRYFGLSSEDLDGKSFVPMMTDAERSEFAGLLESLEPGQPAMSVEHQSVLPDGRRPWLQWELRASFDEAGVPTEVQAVGRDITERKLAEEALQASESRWRSLVESAPEVILTVDRDWRISFINRMPDQATISVRQALGREVTRYVQDDYRHRLVESLTAVLDGGMPQYCEVPFLDRSGKELWYALHLAPIKQDTEIVAIIMVARDISRRRELDEMKDNLIRDVSHELRTPLAKVQMSLELLSELLAADALDRDRASRIGALSTMNVQRLLETVEGILDLSQLESSGLVRQREPVDLGDLVAEVGRYMEPLVEAKRLQLVLDLPGDLPLVEVDRSQIFRVLLNLVDNAVKFSDQGQIVISAAQNGAEVKVSIRDEGHGIDPQNLDRVFERFFQEKARYHGVGVGLTICRAIVEGHSGRIWAESAGKEQGAVVSFTVPVGSMEGEDL